MPLLRAAFPKGQPSQSLPVATGNPPPTRGLLPVYHDHSAPSRRLHCELHRRHLPHHVPILSMSRYR